LIFKLNNIKINIKFNIKLLIKAQYLILQKYLIKYNVNIKSY